MSREKYLELPFQAIPLQMANIDALAGKQGVVVQRVSYTLINLLLVIAVVANFLSAPMQSTTSAPYWYLS